MERLHVLSRFSLLQELELIPGSKEFPCTRGIHLHLLETALDTDTEDDETVCGSSLATLSLVDSEDEISEAEAEGSTEQSLESGTDEENC